MKDLTKGPVGAHVLELSAFIVMTTFFQTLYFLADLYFVGRLGKEAVAGVGLGGTLTLMVVALTQSLAVGATSLIAQALGAKDKGRAERLFNQSLVLATLTGLLFGVPAFLLRSVYCHALAADAATGDLGTRYLDWFVPALFLQFPLVAMGAAVRGLGDVRVPTLLSIVTVLVNIALAPLLMFGWITPRPLGVAGAAIASLVAVALGVAAFAVYLRRPASPLRFRSALLEPRPALWWAMLRIGLPAGAEFGLISVYMVLVYGITRGVGASAQAGFGIGARVMQSLFLPVMAVAFATAPVVGQNFGAREAPRVRETFVAAAKLGSIVMVVMTVLCHIAPEALVRFFNADPSVVAFGAEYLRIISWNFLATGLVFVSSSVFQGLGNTVPPLATSSLRLLLFALPAWLVSRQPGFAMSTIWYLSVASVALQMVLNLWLLRREFGRKLAFEPALA
jgi:putative MATE family efflux protein